MCVTLFPASHEKAFTLNVSFSRYHEFQHSQGNQLSCQQEKKSVLTKVNLKREERGGGGGERELESVGDDEMRMCLQLLHNCKFTVSGVKSSLIITYTYRNKCCAVHRTQGY